ncbi:MAG: ATP-binding protein [Faecalimonas sp.]|nr:ATP-binding protein [Faecalimonas sp.]
MTIDKSFSGTTVPTVKKWAISILILALSTGLGFVFHMLNFTGANTITVYILGALLTALFTKNYICSVVFSFASVFLFNFLFTEPRLSLLAYESGYPVTFAIMLAASLITGTLANRLASSARSSASAAYRTEIMLETTRLLQAADSEDAMLTILAEQIRKLLARDVVVYSASEDVLKEGELFEVKSNTEVFGFIDIQSGTKKLEAFEKEILISLSGECALAIENKHNATAKRNEQLKANLLRSISHDLRTPLTAISGNAESLLKNYEHIGEGNRQQLLTDIYDDSQWLINLVENLLSITRISDGRMQLNMSPQIIDDVVIEALRHISRKAETHHITTELEEGLLLADMDARLISQVILNLVDNAIKYTPAGSNIKVRTKRSASQIMVSVADDGPGIADAIKPKVFEMFYIGENKVVDCRRSLGLGLSLCESIVTAHGGEIWLTDNVPSGCIFTFTLKANEVNLNE